MHMKKHLLPALQFFGFDQNSILLQRKKMKCTPCSGTGAIRRTTRCKKCKPRGYCIPCGNTGKVTKLVTCRMCGGSGTRPDPKYKRRCATKTRSRNHGHIIDIHGPHAEHCSKCGWMGFNPPGHTCRNPGGLS